MTEDKRRPSGRTTRQLNLLLTGLSALVLALLLVVIIRPWNVEAAPGSLPPGESTTTEAAATAAPTTSTTTAPATEPLPTGPVPGTSINLVAAGDVLFHETLTAGGLQADGSYNFDFIFRHIRDHVGQADLAFANMEGTLAGEPYTGYPRFSAPDEVAAAVAQAGFDGMTMANNHSIDKGLEGLQRTLQVVRGQDMQTVGTRLTADEPAWLSIEEKGVKIGIANWTYESQMNSGSRTLNGIPIGEELDGLVNSYGLDPERYRAEFTRLAKQAEEMRTECDLVVFFLHWGTEYRMEPDWSQPEIAQLLADAGVDLIIGSHPHVIEPITLVSSTDGSHQMLTYYSVGNLISDQTYGVGASEGRALDGILANVSFTADAEGQMQLSAAGYMPLFNNRSKVGEAARNVVVPVVAALQDPAAYEADAAQLAESMARTDRVMSLNDTGTLELIVY